VNPQEAIENLLSAAIGLDASSVGRSTLACVIRARMRECACDDMAAYWERLGESDAEQTALIEGAVIGETWFFREAKSIASLQDYVNGRAGSGRTVRIGCVGCSTGEEPYSVAMSLVDGGLRRDEFRVDAWDVSRNALAAARNAVYQERSFFGVAPALRERYFDATPEGCRLKDLIRESVTFQYGNLAQDEFPAASGAYDAVFCRHLLIYLDRPARTRAAATFKRLLGPGGVLFVGAAEAAQMSQYGFRGGHAAGTSCFQALAAPVTPGRPRAVRARPATGPPPSLTTKDAAPRRRAAGNEFHGRPLRSTETTCPLPPPAPAAPTTSAAGLERVRKLADRGCLAEALAECEENVAVQGDRAEAYCLLGLLCEATHDYGRAESSFRKALYLRPEYEEALVHQRLLAEHCGRFGEARILAERLQRLQARGHAQQSAATDLRPGEGTLE